MAKETDGLPRNVARQAEKAEEAQKKLIAGEKTEKTPEQLEKEKQDKAQALAKEALEKGGKSVKTDEPGKEDFEQKYNVLKGKYDKEIPEITRLGEIIRQQSETIETLTRTLSAQQAKGEEEEEVVEKEPEPLKGEDFSGYGEEMIGMVKTVNELMAENKKLKEDLGTVQGNVNAVQDNAIQSAEGTFLTNLDKAIPKWEVVNKDPAFLNWLGQVDPLTGIRRQELLDQAYAAFDAPRVANFFITFTGDGGKPPKDDEVIPPDKDKELEEQIIPDSAGDDGNLGKTEKPKITTAQFNKAMKDAQTGRMTYEAFEKISDQYQAQFSAGA